MAQVASIKEGRTSTGVQKCVTIDLQKHTEFIQLPAEKGVDTNEPMKWTAKMKRSLEQAKRGEIYEIDMNNFWNV